MIRYSHKAERYGKVDLGDDAVNIALEVRTSRIALPEKAGCCDPLPFLEICNSP